ncbi:hypothetical protein D3C85_1142150 [compost metagenome]
MQATSHGRARNFRAMTDLGNRQMSLALLKRLHHRQATSQGGHEIGVAGQGLNSFGW